MRNCSGLGAYSGSTLSDFVVNKTGAAQGQSVTSDLKYAACRRSLAAAGWKRHWSESGGVWVDEGQEVTEQTALQHSSSLTLTPPVLYMLYNVQIIQWQLNAPVLSLCGCFLGLTVYWIFLNVIWTTFLHGASLTVSAKLSVKRSSRCHYGLLCAGEQVEYSPFSPAALHGSLLLSEAGHLSGPGQRKEIFNRTNAGRKKKG